MYGAAYGTCYGQEIQIGSVGGDGAENGTS